MTGGRVRPPEPTQPHQADRAIETGLWLKGAPVAPKVVVPGDERAFGSAFVKWARWARP